MSFFDHAHKLADDFFLSTGKPPNEIHIPERLQGVFHNEIMRRFECHPEDTLTKQEHFWFMGMRVFYEIYSDYVTWTEETEKLKFELKGKSHA